MTRSTRLLVFFSTALLCAGVAAAQGRGGGAEWHTAGGDAQRSSWIRNDAAISVDALTKGGFDVQWKTKVDERARQNQAFGQGVVVSGIAIFLPASIVTGVSNHVYAFDNDTGNVAWQKTIDAPLAGAGTASCPGGITGAVTKMVTVASAAPAAPRAGGPGGGGRGYQSLVGEPGEGAPTLQRGGGPGAAPGGAAGGPGRGAAAPGAVAGREGAPAAGTPPAGAAGAPPAGAAPGGAPQRGGGGGGGGFGGGGAAPEIVPGMPAGVSGAMGGGFGRVAGVAYVIGGDGKLYTVSLLTGKEMQAPAQFIPAGARFADPIAVNNILYVATSGKCGGAADGVWAMDLAADGKPVVSSKPAEVGTPIGAIAFTTSGTPIVATATSVAALDPKTLDRKDWYAAPAGTEITSAPVIFKHGDKDIVAVAAKDGRILMLDAASLGGANHATPLAVSQPVAGVTPLNAPASLATWYELPAPGAAAGSGTKWLLVPAGKLTALKIVDQGGKPSLQPGWASKEIGTSAAPIVVNGAVFALSRGSAATPATLYAMDGATGKELYNSGKAMTSYATGRSFWSGSGQVYVGTADGTVYAFGFAMERK